MKNYPCIPLKNATNNISLWVFAPLRERFPHHLRQTHFYGYFMRMEFFLLDMTDPYAILFAIIDIYQFIEV